MGLRQISCSLSWEGQRGKWILSAPQGSAAFIILQVCCSEVQAAYLWFILGMMHLLSVWMHNANSESKAGFSQSQLASLGTNVQRCPKRITRRNVNAFLRRSMFLYSERQWHSTLQNAIEKSTREKFCHSGKYFNYLNSQQNRSWLLNWKGEVSYSYSTKEEKAGTHPVVSQSFLPDTRLFPYLKTAVQLYGAL